MRPVSLPGLLLAIAVALPAQAQDLHTVPMPGSRKDDLALPLIVSEANPSAASRLNAFVQLVYLDGLLKPGEKDPFARVRYDSNHDGPGSTSSLSWSASSQGRLLSLQVVSETTGAYSTETTDDLLLDATHGQPVSAADLFTPEGMKALGTRLASSEKQNFVRKSSPRKGESPMRRLKPASRSKRNPSKNKPSMASRVFAWTPRRSPSRLRWTCPMSSSPVMWTSRSPCRARSSRPT